MIKDNVRKTCTVCRKRKLRCDGNMPTCGRCAKGRPSLSQSCAYTSQNSTSKVVPLVRGTACLPCRRKKKKCGAQRPCCQACALIGQGDECEYEYTTLEEFQDAATDLREVDALQVVRTSASIRRAPPRSSASISSSKSHYEMFFKPSSNTPPQMNPIFLHSSLATNFSTQLNEYLPVLCPENAPLTLRTSSGGFELRDCFLRRQGQMGLTLTAARAQALRCGDLSGAIIHPVYVPIATLMGFVYWQDTYEQFDSAREENLLEAADVAVLLLRAEFPSDKRLVSLMQAYALMAFYHLWRGRMACGSDYLHRATGVASRLDLPKLFFEAVDGAVDKGRVPGNISVDAWSYEEECIAAFSQLLFLDCDAQTLMTAKPLLSEEQMATFFMLKTIAPAAWDDNLSITNGRGAALLSHVVRLCRVWVNARSTSDSQESMISEYWALVKDASELVATMKVAVLRSAFSDNDACHCVTLKCNLIKCLTSKAILHWLLHDDDESRRLAVECVFEVISITEGFRDDEYPLMDVCVGACWIFAAGIITRDYTTMQQDGSHASMITGVSLLSTAFTSLEVTLPYVSDARKFCKDTTMWF